VGQPPACVKEVIADVLKVKPPKEKGIQKRKRESNDKT
jgi:hypothetical protein